MDTVGPQAHLIINGIIGEKFTIQEGGGVRQGDPLSPYLFDLMAAVLQRMITQAYNNNLLLCPLQQGAPILALQYDDNTLLMLQGTRQQAIYIKVLLETFTKFSGLKISF
jgi:hypothetical protein